MVFRRTFIVAVTSLSSWSSSFSSRRNFRIRSTGARTSFARSTSFAISSRTSGSRERFLKFVYGSLRSVAH
jgi:hypothetical protein